MENGRRIVCALPLTDISQRVLIEQFKNFPLEHDSKIPRPQLAALQRMAAGEVLAPTKYGTDCDRCSIRIATALATPCFRPHPFFMAPTCTSATTGFCSPRSMNVLWRQQHHRRFVRLFRLQVQSSWTHHRCRTSRPASRCTIQSSECLRIQVQYVLHRPLELDFHDCDCDATTMFVFPAKCKMQNRTPRDPMHQNGSRFVH